MRTIFCVEDDENIRELTAYALGTSGFSVEGFENANDFFSRLENKVPDLILLDIMLPETDGVEVLSRLKKRASTREIPVIMLTAKSAEYDKVRTLDMGADDYITKPFGVLELVSRINAVLRRMGNCEKISYKGLVIDYSARTVSADGENIILTNKEFELLHYLAKNRGIVLSRDKIMNSVWGYDFEGETRTVDVHVGTLRQKLGKLGALIETVRSVGYKI